MNHKPILALIAFTLLFSGSDALAKKKKHKKKDTVQTIQIGSGDDGYQVQVNKDKKKKKKKKSENDSNDDSNSDDDSANSDDKPLVKDVPKKGTYEYRAQNVVGSKAWNEAHANNPFQPKDMTVAEFLRQNPGNGTVGDWLSRHPDATDAEINAKFANINILGWGGTPGTEQWNTYRSTYVPASPEFKAAHPGVDCTGGYNSLTGEFNMTCTGSRTYSMQYGGNEWCESSTVAAGRYVSVCTNVSGESTIMAQDDSEQADDREPASVDLGSSEENSADVDSEE